MRVRGEGDPWESRVRRGDRVESPIGVHCAGHFKPWRDRKARNEPHETR